MSTPPIDPPETLRDEALADEEARRLAQTEFERPVVLEAGAGTGKTTTLVARVLAWCLGPGWERAEAAVEQENRELGTTRRKPEGDTEVGTAFGSGGGRDEDDERVAVRVLRGVVALTFTEAAAAEMAARVGRELSRLAAGEPPPAWLRLESGDRPLLASELWRLRARALVSALDHLTLTTIHAWCLGLLSTYPLEANLHPRLTVDADGRRVDEVVAETVETALGRAYSSDPETSQAEDVFLDLAARGQGPGEIAEALKTLLLEGLSPKDLQDDPGSSEACRELHRRLSDRGRALAQSATVRLEAGKRVGKAQDTVRAVRDLLGRLDELGQEGDEETRDAELKPVDLEDLARKFPEKALDLLRKWGRGRFTKSETEALGDAAAGASEAAGDLADLLRHAEGLELLSLAHRALVPLLRTARRTLRSQGVVTFQDLLTGAAMLLGGSGAVQRAVVSRVRRKVDQLLVDEFQDTDVLQCRILRALALEGPEAERPGLFLVGDPKQSIYGWRNADLAAYGSFVRDVEAAGGIRKPLLTSFRSPPALLDEVSRIVEPVMEEAEDLQPPFEPLLPWEELKDAEPFTAGGRGPVEHWTSWRAPAGESGGGEKGAGGASRGGTGPDTRNADADVVEAEAIARDLWELHHRHGTDWRSVALLFRSSTQLEPYLEALRRVGVPFQVSGDRQYYRRREVIEAAALVRTVLDPGDHLALLTLLRSSMVGVPDAALLPLWRRELPRRVLELTGDESPEAEAARLEKLTQEIRDAAAEVPAGIPGLDRLSGWPDALIAALEHLARARRSFRRDPVDVFVALLRDLFLPEPVEAARYLGAYRLANLERFFRTLAEGLEEGGDAGAVLRLLRRSVAEALEAPESPPPEGASDAVQVLTVHSAKGLEFDHVYFVQLHRGSGGGIFRSTEVLRHGGRIALRLLGADGPGFADLDERRRRVEEAEQVRLLYVAVTRARRRLVLTGSRGGKSGGRGKAMAELLEERQDSPASLDGLWERAQKERRAIRDEHDVLWRFPALERREEEDLTDPEAQETSAPPGLPTPDQVARDAQRLDARRSRAARRQERPLSGPASEEAHARLRDLLGAAADDQEVGEPPARDARDPAERRRRMEVGSAVHAVLEQLDLERLATGELAAEVEYRKKALEADLARRLPSADLAAARERAEDLLRRFAEGPLATKLAELSDTVVARELPVLLPAREELEEPTKKPTDHDVEPEHSPPLGFIAGAIDLLYRDPKSGDLVVVDYKTDEVETDEEIIARAGAYTPQGELYRRAVQEALRLPTPPRFELWFLHPGRVVGMG